jgi:hypothetical protein
MSCRYKTVQQMEKAAALEADGSVSVKIRGQWLEVAYLGEGVHSYVWGRSRVTRAVADNVLASAQ